MMSWVITVITSIDRLFSGGPGAFSLSARGLLGGRSEAFTTPRELLEGATDTGDRRELRVAAGAARPGVIAAPRGLCIRACGPS